MGRNDRYKDIQLPQLRSFCLAATSENFTTTAKALGLSAPTVWQQVRSLERQLRTTLLRRRGRTVELTDDGRFLLEIVQPHVSGLDSLESLFAARQTSMPQQLIVASIPYLTSSHLLRPVRAFMADHPAVQLKLQVHVWFIDVVHLVEQGHANLGVIFHDSNDERSAHLDYERLFDLPFALLTPTNHPLARKRHVSPEDIVPYPLIVPPEGSYAWRAFQRLLQRHKLNERVHVVMETPLLDIIRQYVAGGVGIALAHVGHEKSPNLHVRPLDPDFDTISAVVITRKGAHLAGPIQDFRRTLRRFLSDERASAVQ